MSASIVGKKMPNFFKVSEDATMLRFWQEKKNELNMLEICSKLDENLNRPTEAIRDRLRKYLILLSHNDKEVLFKHSEV